MSFQSHIMAEKKPSFEPTGLFQRKSNKCCKKKRPLQRCPFGNRRSEISSPSTVHEVVNSAGQPLDRETLGFMEPRFWHSLSNIHILPKLDQSDTSINSPGDRYEKEADLTVDSIMRISKNDSKKNNSDNFRRDFSDVRVHTDRMASNSAKALNARAYTVGRHIIFDEGQYAPRTYEGKKLLAHELVHVIQQTSGSTYPLQCSLWDEDEESSNGEDGNGVLDWFLGNDTDTGEESQPGNSDAGGTIEIDTGSPLANCAIRECRGDVGAAMTIVGAIQGACAGLLVPIGLITEGAGLAPLLACVVEAGAIEAYLVILVLAHCFGVDVSNWPGVKTWPVGPEPTPEPVPEPLPLPMPGQPIEVPPVFIYGTPPVSCRSEGNKGPLPHPTVRKGSIGAAVGELQEKLNIYFESNSQPLPPLIIDCMFGPKTKEAVVSFQEDQGLDPDGIAGPKTWNALDAAVIIVPPIIITP